MDFSLISVPAPEEPPEPDDESDHLSFSDDDYDALLATVIEDIELTEQQREGEGETTENQANIQTGNVEVPTHSSNVVTLATAGVSQAQSNVPPTQASQVTTQHPVKPSPYPNPQAMTGVQSATTPEPLMNIPRTSQKSIPRLPSVYDPKRSKVFQDISEILRDCDDDQDGELDESEFLEAIHTLDVMIPKRVLQQIYKECIFTTKHQLRIEGFLKILQERNLKPTSSVKAFLRQAFPVIFHISEPGGPRDAEPSLWGMNKQEANQLDYIRNVFSSLDEDEDGKIDFVEFSDGVFDLGVDTDKTQLKFVFANWVVDELRRAKAKKKKRKKKKNKRKNLGDEEESEDDDLPGLNKQLTIGTTKRYASNAELSIAYITEQCKSVMDKQEYPLPVHHILIEAFAPVSKGIVKSKKKPPKRKEEEKVESVLHRKGAVLESLEALRTILADVDEDENGKIDFEEFYEGMSVLHSNLTRMQFSKLFYKQCGKKSKELRIGTFVENVRLRFLRNKEASCDEILEDMIEIAPHTFSKSSSGWAILTPGRDSAVEAKFNFEPQKGAPGALKQVSAPALSGGADFVLNQVEKTVKSFDKDDNGTISMKEFLLFLTKFELATKINAKDIKKIYKFLAEDNLKQVGKKGEACIESFILTLKNVLADHPNYAARRAVYRTLRRILKLADTSFVG